MTMAYPDKRSGKGTGSFVGEWPKGKKKRRFKTLQDAKDYETFCKLMGREPPLYTDEGNPLKADGELTFLQVTEKAKAAGGPKGKWKKTDTDLMQRLAYCCERIGSYGITRVNRGVLKSITDSLDKRPKSAARGADASRRGLLSNARKNRYLTAASGVMQWALQEELIEAKPSVPWLNEKDDRKHRDILLLGQDEVVLGIIEGDGNRVEALCIDMLIQTGLRQGELQALEPDQITIEQVEDDEGTPVPVGVVHLRRGQTKNNTSRPVIFSADLAKQIKAIIATNSLPKADRLLDVFKDACNRAGYTGNLVVHSLRHTRNTRLRKAGVSKKIRKEMLGHLSDEANEIYDHVDLQDQLEAVKKVQDHAGKRLRKATQGGPQVLDFPKSGAG
jgi:integrase